MSIEQSERVHLEYELTAQDMMNASWYVQTHSKAARWYRRHVYFLVFICALLLTDLMFRSRIGTPPILEIGVLLLMVLLTINSYTQGYRQDPTEWDRYIGPYQLDADAHGIRLQSAYSSSQIAWNGFCKFAQTQDNIYLFRTPSSPFAIPRRACRPDQWEQLLRLFKQHLPFKAD